MAIDGLQLLKKLNLHATINYVAIMNPKYEWFPNDGNSSVHGSLINLFKFYLKFNSLNDFFIKMKWDCEFWIMKIFIRHPSNQPIWHFFVQLDNPC